ncbi:MAG: putative membrane protein, partial [uncultured Nocardioides sp.]
DPWGPVPAGGGGRGDHLGAAARRDVPQVRHRDHRARRPGLRHGARRRLRRLLRRHRRGGDRPAVVGRPCRPRPRGRGAAVRHPALRAVRREAWAALRLLAPPVGATGVAAGAPGRLARAQPRPGPRRRPGGRGRADRRGPARRPACL